MSSSESQTKAICSFFQKGKCKKGDSCNFSHDKDNKSTEDKSSEENKLSPCDKEGCLDNALKALKEISGRKKCSGCKDVTKCSFAHSFKQLKDAHNKVKNFFKEHLCFHTFDIQKKNENIFKRDSKEFPKKAKQSEVKTNINDEKRKEFLQLLKEGKISSEEFKVLTN